MNYLELGMAAVMVTVFLSIFFIGLCVMVIAWWLKGGKETVYLLTPKGRKRLTILKPYLIEFAAMGVPVHKVFDKLTKKGWAPFEIKLAIKQVRMEVQNGSKKDSIDDSGGLGELEEGSNERPTEGETTTSNPAESTRSPKKRRWWHSKRRNKDTRST